jgi:hypothetical protein
LKDGRKIVGWKFKVVDNKPARRSKGAVRLPEAVAEEENRRAFERLNSLKVRWKEASEEQKARWVEELPGHMAAFAPAPGAAPRPLFLMALRDLVEPELPLS